MRDESQLERHAHHHHPCRARLGCVALVELSALQIETVLFRLLESGGRHRKTKQPRSLSPKTVRHIASVLRVLLVDAVRKKIIPHQPMAAVELPKVEPREGRALESDELAAYFAEARKGGLFELLHFAAASGCRRGEVLSLQWTDLDLNAGSVRIARSLEQTKLGLRLKLTKSNRERTIRLPPSIIELLRFHRDTQEQSRKLFGADYRTDLDLVFPQADGSYQKPDTVSAKASLIARKAGLANTSLHALRHSHGSALLSAGVPLPEVSRRLGHADVGITAKIYSHALREDDSKAALLWDEHFGKKISGATLRAASGCTGEEKPN